MYNIIINNTIGVSIWLLQLTINYILYIPFLFLAQHYHRVVS